MKIAKAINIYLWLFTVIIALDIFIPSARSTATNGRTPALFNIDGIVPLLQEETKVQLALEKRANQGCNGQVMQIPLMPV